MKLLVWIQLPKPLPVRTQQKCLGKKKPDDIFQCNQDGHSIQPHKKFI